MKPEPTAFTSRFAPRRRGQSRLRTVLVSALLPVAAAALALAPVASRPAHAAATKIPIGWCTMDLEKAKAAGFDFVELAVKGFTSMPDEEFAKFKARHKEVGLPTPVGNNFIPAEMKVVGPEVDEAKVMEYVKKALDRSKELGLKTIVFGSGGARKVPDGFAKEEAMKQLVAIAKKMGPEAKKRGITIAVEPLQSRETNIINSAAEGLEWVKAVNHPNFQLMVDFYHLALEKEDPVILSKAAKHIKHFHIANPHGRIFPKSSEEIDYTGFFENIKKSKYKGGISVEGKANNFETDAPAALAFLRDAVTNGPKKPSDPSVNEIKRPAPAAPAAKPATPTPTTTTPAPPAAPAK